MKKIFIMLFCVLLTACATPYQKEGFSGGYSDMALSQDTYKVSFRGNEYTSQDQVQTLMLRRCAELTLDRGYKYFVLLSSNTDANRSVRTTPTTIESGTDSDYSSYGNNTQSDDFRSRGSHTTRTRTTIEPGRTYVVTSYTTTVTVKMLTSKKKYPSAFEAVTVLSNFKEST